jgi:hypothetical protein
LSKPRAILRAFVSLCEEKGKKVKKAWLPAVLFVLILLFVGILAITQEAEEESVLDELALDDMIAGLAEENGGEGELPPIWEPPGPPRWFRSNAGGMTLEEIPSRLAALRNKYALVIDYIPPEEIEPRLLPYYKDEYIIEIRILYEQGAESRRQWLFRDEAGTARLNAVFIPPAEERPEEQPEEQPDKTEIEPEETAAEIDNDIDTIEEADKIAEAELEETEPAEEELSEVVAEVPDESPPEDEPQTASVPERREMPVSLGFIEIFNETSRITEERQFFDDGSETLILYSYNTNILVKAEAREKREGEEYHTAYVDYYRYNRSYSLRHVERQFHEATYRQPVRLTFPGRVLDAASDENFISDKLMIVSDFLGSFSAGEGYRTIYTTDSKGRILTQTMLNDKDEEIWVIVNTWSGDRIVAMEKTEGEDKKVTEYEYDSAGDRIVQRDIHNGALERLVRTNGDNETEELYLDGTLVLKAYWVNGKKVSEERVRRR